MKNIKLIISIILFIGLIIGVIVILQKPQVTTSTHKSFSTNNTDDVFRIH